MRWSYTIATTGDLKPFRTVLFDAVSVTFFLEIPIHNSEALFSVPNLSVFFGQGGSPNTVSTLFDLTRCDYLSDFLDPGRDECLSDRGVPRDISLRSRETVRQAQR